jgi:hypothetical protein
LLSGVCGVVEVGYHERGKTLHEGAVDQENSMKKLVSIMLGLALACTTVSVTFAESAQKKAGKKKGGGKKKKGGMTKKGGKGGGE